MRSASREKPASKVRAFDCWLFAFQITCEHYTLFFSTVKHKKLRTDKKLVLAAFVLDECADSEYRVSWRLLLYEHRRKIREWQGGAWREAA